MAYPDIADVHTMIGKYAKECFELQTGNREILRDIKHLTAGWSEENFRWAMEFLCFELKEAGKEVLLASCPCQMHRRK